jgi:hypothetical protein
MNERTDIVGLLNMAALAIKQPDGFTAEAKQKLVDMLEETAYFRSHVDDGPVAEAMGYDRDEDEDEFNTCTECGEPNDDGEGWNGLCGNCADKAEDRS